MISTNPATGWKGVKVKMSDQNVRAFSQSEYEKIISSVDETTMTPVNKARIKTLMQLQRWSGLSLVDAVCLSKDELKRERKGEFRVVTDRQKTGTLINNVIPAWLGEELIRVKNGNPPSRRIWTRPWMRPSSAFRPSKKLGTMCFSPPACRTLLRWLQSAQRYRNRLISWWESRANHFR